MSFFRDFKDDFSESIDEVLPKEKVEEDDDVINTISDNVDNSLSKLDDLLDKANDRIEKDEPTVDTIIESTEEESKDSKEILNDIVSNEPAPSIISTSLNLPVSDENAIITSGMVITGDIETTGSIEIQGRVNGNVVCQGKLTVTGMISGNSQAAEVFADAARIDGEISSTGPVKIGSGSVVVGNITSTSAVVAGAVKGDIDVHGPVVVDTSAVVMGNVKSMSVQINNGAIIEGFCSQAYADTDVASVFKN